MGNKAKRIAVLSGKGGTGKTFVSVNLASVIDGATYIDCDVEEPNGDLFFKSKKEIEKDVFVKIPKVDMSLCDGCQKCVDFCEFNALAYLPHKILIYDKMCHSCGGCMLVCPQKAITEVNKAVGTFFVGSSEKNKVISGMLNIGEATGVPIIENMLKVKTDSEVIVIDCPPGSSCLVMESIKDADYCILVLEPTIFGLHNFKMVCELVRLFKKPFGVIVNKYVESKDDILKILEEEKIDVIQYIEYSKLISETNSSGIIVSKMFPEYKSLFLDIYEKIKGKLL